MNTIKLQFDKTLTALSGNDFGLETYRNQIQEKIDMKNGTIIVFDDAIKIISISFVKGMLSDLLQNYTNELIKEKIKFECFSDELENSIWDSLNF